LLGPSRELSFSGLPVPRQVAQISPPPCSTNGQTSLFFPIRHLNEFSRLAEAPKGPLWTEPPAFKGMYFKILERGVSHLFSTRPPFSYLIFSGFGNSGLLWRRYYSIPRCFWFVRREYAASPVLFRRFFRFKKQSGPRHPSRLRLPHFQLEMFIRHRSPSALAPTRIFSHGSLLEFLKF